MATLDEVLDYLDPDWRDHLADAERASEHYQRYAPVEWRVAYRSVTGEEWDTL